MKRSEFWLSLCVGLSALVLMAPTDKPEKISLNDASFDDTASEFTLQFTAMFGIATAGENAAFDVCTTLVIDDAAGNPLANLGPECHPVEPLHPDDDRRDTRVPLVPQSIAWDPAGFTGTAVVTVTSELQKEGIPVANTETILVEEVVITDRDTGG